MAIFLATNHQIFVNGVDLSDHVRKVTTTDSRDKVDITAMGATNRVYTKGLGDGGCDIEFYQDFAAAKVHATLQPLIGSSTPVNIEVRPVNGARSATNPAFLLSGLLFTYPFLDNAVGDASVVTAHFDNGSQSGVTYPTS